MRNLYFIKEIPRNQRGLGRFCGKWRFEYILTGENRPHLKEEKPPRPYILIYLVIVSGKNYHERLYETIYFYKSQKNLLFIIFVPKKVGQIGRKSTHDMKQSEENGLKITQEGGVINISGLDVFGFLLNKEGFTDKTISKEVLVLLRNVCVLLRNIQKYLECTWNSMDKQGREILLTRGYRLLVIITNLQGFTDKTRPKEVLVLF
ncbi:MAG: hypothetical protein A2452_07390 [Candidatus Firestonebacteria bacterium RIFOXYC2_FULL_39_67]|nr:MAG: hypothetical protein A2452_07390 [Candidatus Firestonebacteria bacterium RIFOXYC2_FULL_39_67]